MELRTFRACQEAAARVLKGHKRRGLMGDPLTAVVTTHMACAMHGPNDHFYPISIQGRDFREEWLKAYETVDPNNGPSNPLTPDDAYLVRFGTCDPSAVTFRPIEGRIAIFVHSGALHLMVGDSHDGTRPRFASQIELAKGSRFEIVQPNIWWAIAPIDQPVLTVTGMRPKYDRVVDEVKSLPPPTVRAIGQAVIDL